MSKAEDKKENSLLNLGKQILDLTEDQKRLMREVELMSNKTHTNQTLQELKEKVKHENGYIEGNVELLAKDHVLQLIDEVRNE